MVRAEELFWFESCFIYSVQFKSIPSFDAKAIDLKEISIITQIPPFKSKFENRLKMRKNGRNDKVMLLLLHLFPLEILSRFGQKD